MFGACDIISALKKERPHERGCGGTVWRDTQGEGEREVEEEEASVGKGERKHETTAATVSERRTVGTSGRRKEEHKAETALE